jgi:hypothetical protein
MLLLATSENQQRQSKQNLRKYYFLHHIFKI